MSKAENLLLKKNEETLIISMTDTVLGGAVVAGTRLWCGHWLYLLLACSVSWARGCSHCMQLVICELLLVLQEKVLSYKLAPAMRPKFFNVLLRIKVEYKSMSLYSHCIIYLFSHRP